MAAEGSGRGRRARFAMTCALMQRYMRENQRRAQQAGNNNNLAGRLLRLPPPLPAAAVAPPSWENGGDRRTMQLFPVRAGGAAMAQPAPQQRPPELMRAPMTIFYGGQVITVENVPVDRGHQLVHMVARSSVVNAPPRAPPEVVVLDVPEDDDEPEVIGESSAGANQQGSMARKASLERFLRKRKRRVNGGFDPDHNDDAWPPAKKMDAGSGGGEPFEDVPDALWLRL
ncbi:unnamed protein product [Urochloa decumbens]|uniref:Protein TIFY n=1 Tax=Urochloa decumbens TaxID=240449 RepID=A0ABC8X1B3_9POAL